MRRLLEYAGHLFGSLALALLGCAVLLAPENRMLADGGGTVTLHRQAVTQCPLNSAGTACKTPGKLCWNSGVTYFCVTLMNRVGCGCGF